MASLLIYLRIGGDELKKRKFGVMLLKFQLGSFETFSVMNSEAIFEGMMDFCCQSPHRRALEKGLL